MTEIFAENCAGIHRVGGRQNTGIPVAKLKPFFNLERMSDDFDRDRLYWKSEERFQNGESLVVSQPRSQLSSGVLVDFTEQLRR